MLALTSLEVHEWVPLTTEENIRFKVYSRAAADDFDNWGEVSVPGEFGKNRFFSWEKYKREGVKTRKSCYTDDFWK